MGHSKQYSLATMAIVAITVGLPGIPLPKVELSRAASPALAGQTAHFLDTVCTGGYYDIQADLPAFDLALMDWDDYDGDADLDLVITGVAEEEWATHVYRNDGAGAFERIVADLPGIYLGAVDWGDYDGDGDGDILLAGYQPDSAVDVTTVYRNDGGVFTDIAAGLIGIEVGSAAWGDYDHDGDLDILLAGYALSLRENVSRIYRNDGNDVFSAITTDLIGGRDSVLAWGDYDTDDDLDILLSGYITSTQDTMTRIYRNDGNDDFTELSANLTGTRRGSLDWGDYDGDDDLDILLSGSLPSFQNDISQVYRNDGSDTFTHVEVDLIGTSGRAAAWGDYDGDGDLDIVLSGSSHVFQTGVTRIYRNDGNDVFTDTAIDPIDIPGRSLAWADYDNDGDLEILLPGGKQAPFTTAVYEFAACVSNLAVNQVASPALIAIQQSLTYTITVASQESYTATGVILTDTLPISVRLNSLSTTQGHCSGTESQIICDLGGIPAGEAVTVTLSITTPVQGGRFITNSAVVKAAEPEFHLPDNANELVILVENLPGDRYLDPAGSDAGDCSDEQQRCRSLAYAGLQAATGDTIYLNSGTYISTSATIDRDVILQGSGAMDTILAGNRKNAVVKIVDSAVRLTSLTITDGGGGISVANGQLSVENCLIGNSGTGILNSNGSVALTNSEIYSQSMGIDNRGDLTASGCRISSYVLGAGSGVYNSGNSTISGCVIEGFANSGIRSVGEPAAPATVTVLNSVIQDNSGTGIYNQGHSAMTVEGSTLRRNYGSHQAGAIYNGPGPEARLIIRNSTLDQHGAKTAGGAIYNDGGIAAIANSTFSGNDAKYGGAIWHQGGQLFLDNVTIAGNTASVAGAGLWIGANSLTVAANSLLANDSIGGDCKDDFGQLLSLGHNLNRDGACPLDGPGDLLGVDPRLGPLAGNGGPTWTYGLLPGSPAIDGGSCTASNGEPVGPDQRGLPRPQGATCDIGAYEALSGAGAGVWGRAWVDSDDDGQFAAGELPVPDLAIVVRDGQGEVVALAASDDDGFYQAAGLAAGSYSVASAEHPGHIRLSPAVITVTLQSGQEARADFRFGVATGVGVQAFAVQRQGLDALVAWQAAPGQDLLGFNLYRSPAPPAPRDRLNGELIPASGDEFYSYLDRGMGPGVTYYWLEAVSDSGSQFIGPVALESSDFQLFVPLVWR